MSNLDRELEKGIDALLRPLLEPPAVYAVAAAIAGWLVWWKERPLILRTLVWLSANRLEVVLLAVAALSLPVALLAAAHWLGWPDWLGLRRRSTKDLVRDWPELAEGLGLGGSLIRRVERDRVGMTADLELNRFRGQHPEDVIAKLPRLESALGTRPGAVRVIADPEHAARCQLRVVERDPLARPIPWSQAAPPSAVDQALHLGLFEDGSAVEFRLSGKDRQPHVLVGGVTGGGKSGIINVVLGNLAYCRDVVLWGVDLKGGMELAPWSGVLERLATSPAEARSLLAGANRVLDARTRLLASRRRRVWEPTAGEPLLVVVVDEVSELDSEGLRLVQRVARLGRAAAVRLIIATQRPSADQLASEDESGVALRGQLQTRICMRVAERREADMILGAGLVREGWQADRVLRQPGAFLIHDQPDHVAPRPARAFLMRDQDVEAVGVECASNRPSLDEVSSVAFAELAVDSGNGQGAIGLGEVVEFPQSPQDRLLAVLGDADSDGLLATEIAEEVGRSRAWVFQTLKVLAAEGRVEKTFKGRWRAREAARR